MVFIDKIREYCGGSRVLAWLLTVTAGAGIVVWLSGVVAHFMGVSAPGTWLALPADPVALMWRPWTFVTYLLIHYSLLHALFNLLWLYWFGRMLADVVTDRTLFWLYVGGGVAGALLYIIWSQIAGYTSGSYLTGDSAAVLSIMIVTALKMPDRELRFFLIGDVRLKWVALVMILLTFISSSGGSLAAHTGGLMFGLGWYAYTRGLIRVNLPQKRRMPAFRPRNLSHAFDNTLADSTRLEARLDELLDKVRISGYDSLTAKEKNELNYISARLKKK